MPKSTREFWFGTLEKMGWFPLPLSGADTSPASWSESGTLLNGEGFGMHSWSSHKQYQFDWSSASTRAHAQKMKSYRDGTFGRGLIYFIDPLTYTTNVLPARWADPSMAVGDSATALVYNARPGYVPTSSADVNDLPVRSATYPVAGLPTTVASSPSVFIPIPEGYTLALGAIYTAPATTCGVYYTPVDVNGNDGTAVRLTPLDTTSSVLTNTNVSGIKGVRLWVGKTSGTTGSLTLTAMTGRMFKSSFPGTPPSATQGPWIGGQGHGGVRFDSDPTYVNNTGVNGGQIGFSASFREVKV